MFDGKHCESLIIVWPIEQPPSPAHSQQRPRVWWAQPRLAGVTPLHRGNEPVGTQDSGPHAEGLA